jgi:transketolase
MDETIAHLNKMAKKIRGLTFKAMANAGGGHFGGSLSIVEILTVLYFEIMKVDPERPNWDERDIFILSKGHAGPALYTTLAMRGYFPLSFLDNLDKPLSSLPKHVDRLKLKGIEVSTGPLGQFLSIACGMGISLKQQSKKNCVYILLGDGECNSGQVWEAAMTASKYNLDNLAAIIDRNNYQIDGPSEEVMPLEPLKDKFISFGWHVFHSDGHDPKSLIEAFHSARQQSGKPSVVIANTKKGYGVSFMENRQEWHSGKVTREQYEIGCAELGEKSDK